MRSYLDGMLRYFEFSGRSSRRQYWLFWLIATILGLAAILVDHQLYGIRVDLTHPGPFTVFSCIVHTVPAITVTVRRLHDINRSGWYYFIQLIPIAGGLVLFYWMLKGPDLWDNRFGHDPREENLLVWTPSPQKSTIPRQVRMGSATQARPFHLEQQGEVQRFI